MKNEIVNKHDSTFKEVFSQKRIAKDFIENNIPKETLETIIYYGEIYLKYIELTNSNVTEEDIRDEIKKLDGKGAVTMSILQRREEIGIKKGIKERNIEIAKNLIEEGVELALVVKTTGLSKSQVELLKTELDR